MKKVLRIICISSLVLLGLSCTRESRDNRGNDRHQVDVSNEQKQEQEVEAIPPTPRPTQTLHVFVENSGSMNGYINKASDFQMAIGRAIQLMKFKYGDENIKTYYINQNVHEYERPVDEDVYNFMRKMLERQDFTTSGTGKMDKGTQSTDLNDIVKKVLGYVDENNTVILISDFIYSLSANKGVTTSLLYDCQNLTMSAFLEKTKELPSGVSLATNLIQLYSNFEGKYWHWEKPTGNGYVNLNCKRPYYICVLGTDDNVKDFNRDININELREYKNQFTISNKDVSNADYTILDTKFKKGAYRHGSERAIHSISKVSKNNAGEFEMGIGIDLSDFSMSETDKIDNANYTMVKGNYRIDRIEVIDTTKLATPIDKKLVRDNHCTHVIVVACTGFPNDLSISIKRDLPQWIRESSSTDDRRIGTDEAEQLKTFGIAYFVEGISDAYKYLAKDKNNFMTINVTIKNK